MKVGVPKVVEINLKMGDNVFWFSVWAMIVTGVIIVGSIIAWYFTNQNNLQASLIREGYPPLEVRCMDAKRDDSICLTYVATKDKLFIVGSGTSAGTK